MKQTKSFIKKTALAFVLMTLPILYGGKFIFENQKISEDRNSAIELSLSGNILKNFFIDFERDVRLVVRIPDFKEYIENNFSSAHADKEVRDILKNMSVLFHFIRSISVIDSRGNERIGLYSDGKRSGLPANSNFVSIKKSLEQISALPTGRFYVSPIMFGDNTGKNGPPIIRLGYTLSKEDGEKKGVLFVDLNIADIVNEILPPKMFIQTPSGYQISLGDDKTALVAKSPYTFTGQDGSVRVSDSIDAHFKAVEFYPENFFFIGMIDNHAGLKNSLIKVVFVSMIMFTVFSLLMLTLTFRTTKATKELEESHRAIIFSLANLAEWRDPETGYHLERTRNYGVLLARELRKKEKYKNIIDEQFISDLYNAAPLHDIGKVGVRDSILLKEGKLTQEEFEIMKKHVLIGKNILRDVIEKFNINRPFLVMSKNIAAYHHERYDGSGYTKALRGDDIPLEARIYAVCDSYDAIRAKRPYKEPITHEKAIEFIVKDKGRHFDPDMVDAFISCEKEFMEVFETYRFFIETYSEDNSSVVRKDLKVEWDESLSVGVSEIDNQHKELIRRINSLLEAILHGKGKEKAAEMLSFLENYTTMHFGTEEAYMLKYSYPDYNDHLLQHQIFIKELSALNRHIETQGVNSDLVIKLNHDVISWLINHICKVDKELGSFLKVKLAEINLP
ncbi:MAG: bacteriohemerythrin [Nitrospirae bacterium]|nr:MAG: bacteriohemerythrin [Nitrospirota bacterium]